jgi:ligand-binding SRPBCC domain-containing protein
MCARRGAAARLWRRVRPHIRILSEKLPVDAARTYRIEREQWLARPIAEVFTFFGDATNLEAITPEWLRFSVITPAPIVMGAGTLIEYKLRWRRMPLRWTTLIEAWEPPHRFVDTQLQGPYRLWHHTHTFEAQMGGTLIRDEVRYRLSLGWLGVALHRLGIRRDLEAIFNDRARRVRELLEPGRGPGQIAGSDLRR